MDKTINAHPKSDYATILSRISQAPKVESGTENLLTVNDDKVCAPNVLRQHVHLSMKFSQNATRTINSKKQTVKPKKL